MANTAQNPDDFLPLTPAEFHLMLALADDDLHGYGMMQAVKRRTNGAMTIGPGTLYGTIKRLLERGWLLELDSREEEGERRRYYRLSDFGGRVLRAEAARLAHLVDAARDAGLLPGGAS